MTWEELKSELKNYLDGMTEEPTEKDIEILGFIEDYVEPSGGFSEEEVNERVSAAVAESDARWTKKFKDRFYGRDEEAEPETVVEPEVVDNEPEQEEFKSILDYEW